MVFPFSKWSLLRRPVKRQRLHIRIIVGRIRKNYFELVDPDLKTMIMIAVKTI